MLRYLVLGLLRNGKPRHGYALMKAYRMGSGLQVSTGNFYRELARLLASGRVEAAAPTTRADPRRTLYRITHQGAACFDEWFAAPLNAAQSERLDDLGLRVLVLPDTEPATLHQTIERWKGDIWLRIKLLEQARDHAARLPGDSDGVRSLLLGRRLDHLSADVECLCEFQRKLNAKVRSPAVEGTRSAPAAQPGESEGPTPTPRKTASRLQ